jgi:hypothetical protein
VTDAILLSMELVGVLDRIEQRLTALDISAREGGIRAGKTDAIYNIRKSIRRAHRQGVSDTKRHGVTDTTLRALARALECRAEWLMTGAEISPADDVLKTNDGLTENEAIELLELMFIALEATSAANAHQAARFVLKAFRSPPTARQEPLSEEQRRGVLENIIRLFRQ